MNKIALLALPLLLAACVTTSAAQVVPDGSARIGQTVNVGGPKVRPLKVVQDSRCPAEVTCVWAGTVVLRAEVITGRGKRVMELTLDKPVRVADGMLTLKDVRPGIGQGPYRFYFDFKGGL